jgi:hypothetical protein
MKTHLVTGKRKSACGFPISPWGYLYTTRKELVTCKTCRATFCNMAWDDYYGRGISNRKSTAPRSKNR